MTFNTVTFNLDLEEVKANARKAYDAGLLTAQAPNSADRECMYFHACDDGIERRCAIGWSLPDTEKARRLQGTVGSLALSGCFKVMAVGGKDLEELKRIQMLHDFWCGPNGPLREETNRKEFLAAIDHPEGNENA